MTAGTILRRTAGVVVLGALLILRGSPASAENANVGMQADNTFTPAGVTIDPGDSVTWTNQDLKDHTVTFEDLPFDEEVASCDALRLSCESVELTFDEPGTYPYYCDIHGSAGGVGMAGVVSVQGPSTTTTSAPSTTTTVKPATTTTTEPPTTTTSRPLTTSSAVVRSTTTTPGETTTTRTPNAAPVFDPGGGDTPSERDDGEQAVDEGVEEAADEGEEGGATTGAVAVIVGVLLAVAAVGGVLLWRLRPGRDK